MRYSYILILCVFLLSCSSLDLITNGMTCKEGIIVFNTEESFYFRCSDVEVTTNYLIIKNSAYKAKFKWQNVRTIHIYNSCSQEIYKKQLEDIKNFSDKNSRTK